MVDDSIQKKNALADLELAKQQREKDRLRRVHTYGILNRKEELSREVIRKARLACDCGAFIECRPHKETCPVIRSARAERKV